jgi:N-acyl-D-amino-acid deacylase
LLSRRAVSTAIASVFVAASTRAASARYDLIIEGADVVDGTGAERRRADVAVLAGSIVAIGDLSQVSARRRIEARGKVITPGFIDLMGQDCLRYITSPGTVECRLRQGITTHFAGEGWSHAPENTLSPQDLEIDKGRPPHGWQNFAELNAFMRSRGMPINVMHNVGAGQVRSVVMGLAPRAPNASELSKMETLVDRAMRDGVAGLSTALIYPPNSYANTDELIALTKVVGRYGGTYYSHVRNESQGLLGAIGEAMDIGRAGNAPVHIFHLKAAGRENWHLFPDAIARINEARAKGTRITSEIYPYTYNGTNLRVFVDPDTQRDPDVFSKLGDPALRAHIRRQMETGDNWENWYRHVGRDWSKVIVTSPGDYEPAAAVAGLSIAEAARRSKKDAWDVFFALIAAKNVIIAAETMDEAQKRLALQQPWVAVGTDSLAVDPKVTHTSHPRAFGTFPRILAKYVREEHVLTLEDAVRRMTSLAASIIGVRDRGTIAQGMAADLAIFDPAHIRDRATLTQPTLFSEGIDFLLVNGELVIDAGQLTNKTPGKVLLHNA